MRLNVNSARGAARMILSFGFFFLILAATFFGFKITEILYPSKNGTSNRTSDDLILDVFINADFLLNGYPVLIGIWSPIVGAVGVCASNPRRSGNATCLIITFCIFSISLFGSEIYAIIFYSPHLKKSIDVLRAGDCGNDTLVWKNCYVHVALDGGLVLTAALILIMCIWSVACCFGSFWCSNDDAERDPQDQQQVVYDQQSLVMEPLGHDNKPVYPNPPL